MEYGLSKESINLILEDALRHDENLTKLNIIEAVTTAIIENNKKLEQDLKKKKTSAKEFAKNLRLNVDKKF